MPPGSSFEPTSEPSVIASASPAIALRSLLSRRASPRDHPLDFSPRLFHSPFVRICFPIVLPACAFAQPIRLTFISTDSLHRRLSLPFCCPARRSASAFRIEPSGLVFRCVVSLHRRTSFRFCCPALALDLRPAFEPSGLTLIEPPAYAAD